ELRASRDRCAFLLGSWSCTVEAAQLVESGWAALAAALKAAQAARMARGVSESARVRIRVDPPDIG
ncbi:hypothetical protein, partial [Streptomyces scabiei]|uniref:hypothetical protein n=1 Tax=Streptomyces scabiei TaxID=1930 RepID=UPI0029B10516